MDEEMESSRAYMIVLEARSTYATLIAELAFSIGSIGRPQETVVMFIDQFLLGLEQLDQSSPGDPKVKARVRALFEAFLMKHRSGLS